MKKSNISKATEEEKVNKKLVAKEQIPKNIGFLMELGCRHMISACLFTTVDLGCFDAIGDDELTAAEVVSRLPSENRAIRVQHLERLLRVVAQDGLVKERANEKGDAVFRLTDAGALLQTGAPQPSLKSMMFHWNEPATVLAFTCIPELLHSKDHNDSAFSLYHKKPIFDWFGENTKSNKMFNDFMELFSTPEQVQVVNFFENELSKDVPKLDTAKIADIGAGYGHVMEALVHQCPNLQKNKPVVFDLPHVIDDVKEQNEHLEYVKGDFFEVDTIPEADVYFMKHIMHDWDDEKCVVILKHLGYKLAEEGRVVVYDVVLPAPGEEGDPLVKKAQFYLDLVMMGLVTGKERTRAQWSKLGQDAGFDLVRIAEPSQPAQMGRILIFKKK